MNALQWGFQLYSCWAKGFHQSFFICLRLSLSSSWNVFFTWLVGHLTGLIFLLLLQLLHFSFLISPTSSSLANPVGYTQSDDLFLSALPQPWSKPPPAPAWIVTVVFWLPPCFSCLFPLVFSQYNRVILLKYVASYTLPFWILQWLPFLLRVKAKCLTNDPWGPYVLWLHSPHPTTLSSSPFPFALLTLASLLFLKYTRHVSTTDLSTCWSFYVIVLPFDIPMASTIILSGLDPGVTVLIW